jgi:hypothetical protein
MAQSVSSMALPATRSWRTQASSHVVKSSSLKNAELRQPRLPQVAKIILSASEGRFQTVWQKVYRSGAGRFAPSLRTTMTGDFFRSL